MNDTYLAGSGYTRVNRKHVLCQEDGHTFGLGHQDESGADLGTCMDYASALDNPDPNGHDEEQLKTIYGSHADATYSATVPATTTQSRGNLRRVDDDLYVEDLGNDRKRYVWVLWKQRGIPHSAPQVD